MEFIMREEQLSPWEIVADGHVNSQRKSVSFLKESAQKLTSAYEIGRAESKTRSNFSKNPISDMRLTRNKIKYRQRLEQKEDRYSECELTKVSIARNLSNSSQKVHPPSLLPCLKLYKTTLACKPFVVETINFNRRYNQSRDKEKENLQTTYFLRTRKYNSEIQRIERKKTGIKMYNLFN